MSIALSIPSIGGLNADAPGLNRADLAGAGLYGVTGPLLSNPNSQPPPLPALPASSGLAIQNAATAASANATTGVDPLTPRGLTASGAVALTNVISTVTTALNGVQNNTATGFTQLLQSPGFQVLLQVLGAGDTGVSNRAGTNTGTSSTAQLASLLQSGSSPSANPTASTAAATGPNPSTTSTTGSAPGPGNHASGNQSPYFQKLLGELESTYKASAPTTNGAALNTSELDLFLKWLSLNGAGSVVASA